MFLLVASVNPTNDSISFLATSGGKIRNKLAAQILINLQNHRAGMPTARMHSGADFVHSVCIFSDLNL